MRLIDVSFDVSPLVTVVDVISIVGISESIVIDKTSDLIDVFPAGSVESAVKE